MINLKFLLLLIILLLNGLVNAYAQPISRYNTFRYSVNEGLLQSAVSDIAFDKNNFCWLSFTNGIQKFDGNTFTEIPIQAGLPDDKSVSLFTTSEWEMFVAHTSGLSKYDVKRDKFILVHPFKTQSNYSPMILGESDGILYLFHHPGMISGVNMRNFKVERQSAVIYPIQPLTNKTSVYFSTNIVNNKITALFNQVFSFIDLKSLKIIDQSPPFLHINPYWHSLQSGDEVLFYQFDKNSILEKYTFSTGKTDMLISLNDNTAKAARGTFYLWENKPLLAHHNELMELDGEIKNIKSRIVNFQNQPIGNNSSIKHITSDRTGNLYLLTINDGIRKVIKHNYPIKYFGTQNKEANYSICISPDKLSNRILVGTVGNGIFVFDTSQNLVKHIKFLPGVNHPFSPCVIVKNAKGNYLIMAHSEQNAWELSNDLSTFKKIDITAAGNTLFHVGYYASILYKDSVKAIVQTDSRLYKMNLVTNRITQQVLNDKGVMASMLIDSMIVTHVNDELYFMDTSDLRIKSKRPLKNTGGVRCLRKVGNSIYVGGNKGIFKLDKDGNLLMHLNKEKGLPDECIYSLTIDAEENIWCGTNKGLVKVNKDLGIFQFNKEDGLQENEFNTNVTAQTKDGEMFFGGVNGVSSFYPSGINAYTEDIRTLVTKIKINNQESFTDTAAWNIDRIELPHDRNSLSFDIIAMAGNNPNQYVYQYMMEGIDAEWIQNKDLQTVRYLLPPGKYKFRIFASRFFDKNAKAQKEIEIIIHPPFWKTWWFIFICILLLTTLLIIGINRYNRTKYNRKLAEIEAEFKVQMERERISRDLHDSVGAYANAVLYNIELLQNEEAGNDRIGLMNDLKFASKDIITALRETVWAFKKGEYSAQDCLLRIRNFIHPFSRYYQHINFRVEGDAPAGMQLHSANALNLVRIVQEAVTNAIKHSKAKNISVINSVDNGKWLISICDDGEGFDPQNSYEMNTGNGLTNMKKRAEDSGAELSIESQPGKGCEVNIRI